MKLFYVLMGIIIASVGFLAYSADPKRFMEAIEHPCTLIGHDH